MRTGKRNFLAIFLFIGACFAQTQFSTAVGDTSDNRGYSVIQTTDDGFAVTGYTLNAEAGDWNIPLVKFNSTGSVVWSRTFIGIANDCGWDVAQTTDDGYVVGGWTESFGAGSGDFLLTKYNSSGDFEWCRTAGGTETDWAKSVVQSFDGGYALAGWTYSFSPGSDYLITKFNSTGDFEWSRTIGTTSHDYCYDVIHTIDRGYALAGKSEGYGLLGFILFVKLDSTGAFEWARAIGDSSSTISYDCYSCIQTADSGYVFTGWVQYFSPTHYELYLVKISSSGALEWSRSFRVPTSIYSYQIALTSDDGYVVAGDTYVSSTSGYDFFIAKFNSSGVYEWSRALGGISVDYGKSVIQTMDGGFASTGMTYSFGAGNWDLLLVKLDNEGNGCIGEYFPLTATDVSSAIIDVTPTVAVVSPTVTDVTPIISDTIQTVTEICSYIPCDNPSAQWLCPNPCWQFASCEDQVMVGTLWSDSTEIDTSRVYFTVNPGVGLPFQLHEPSPNIDFTCLTADCDSILAEIRGFSWTDNSTVTISLDSAFTIDSCKTTW